MTEAPLRIHDTLSGHKRPLEPLEPGKVGIYCCGPTTYDMAHIGHARAALLPDLLVRFLRRRGLEVKYVRNVTDVDDKIINRAAERGEEPTALSERFAEEYRRDMADLRMLAPDVEPKVSEHIEPIIGLISGLVERDLAYAVEGGDVYYRVDRFEGYGKLSGRKLEDMQAGARVEVDARKEHPMDFALWKGAKPGEPAWESPWGPGRPGWHIECSAMSETHLGESFDVHTGGRDLIFPHHENEIAQSQGCHGEHTYARNWMHNGFVNFAGEKMSKSLGNFFTIREVTALYHPEVLRFFLLGVHYRSGVNFDVEVTCPGCEVVLPQEDQQAHRCSACGAELTDEALRRRVRFVGLEEADERVAYVYETLRAAREFLERGKAQPLEGEVVPSVETMLERFDAAMADDLNTAAAQAELSEALSEVNRLLQTGKGVDKKLRYRTIARFVADMEAVGATLGLFERVPAEWLAERRDLKARRIGLDVAKVESLLSQRDEARRNKDFEAADRVRADLDALGVEVRDGPDGSIWSL